MALSFLDRIFLRSVRQDGRWLPVHWRRKGAFMGRATYRRKRWLPYGRRAACLLVLARLDRLRGRDPTSNLDGWRMLVRQRDDNLLISTWSRVETRPRGAGGRRAG